MTIERPRFFGLAQPYRRPHCRPCCDDVCRGRQPTFGTGAVRKGHFMQLFPQAIHRALFGALAVVMLVAPARAADPVFPVNSRIGLVAPAGFTPSTKFQGFENPEASAAILLAELPGDAYADVEKGFTDEALKARGMTV